MPWLGLDQTEVALLSDQPCVRFRVTGPAPEYGETAAPAGLRDRVRATVLHGQWPRLHARCRPPPGWGSAPCGGRVAEAVGYPLFATRHHDLARLLLAEWELAELLRPGTGSGPTFRRTCCLAVAVPGLGVCDTCPVTRARLSAADASMTGRSR